MKHKLKYILLLALLTFFCTAGVVASAQVEGDTESTAETESNFFTKLYEDISAYTSEILCALTFAGSVTVAIAYKKGLLPLINSTLGAIGGAVTKIKESTTENEATSAALEKVVNTQMNSACERLDELTEKISYLDAKIEEVAKCDSDAVSERQRIRLIMESQINMLYDIFMSSALPQYQKDAVGERISEMKEAIASESIEK